MKELKINVPSSVDEVKGIGRSAIGILAHTVVAIGHAIENISKEKPKEVGDMLRTHPIPLTGTRRKQKEVKALKGDEKLDIVLEDNNVWDTKAVGVYAGVVKIGYLPAKPIEGWEPIPRDLIRDKAKKGKKYTIDSWFKVGGAKTCPRTGIRVRLLIER